MTTTTFQSKGKKRVRVNFNPSNDPYLDEVKLAAANLIDLINSAAPKPEWDDETTGEWKRLQSLAMISIEEGAMWAVKAITI